MAGNFYQEQQVGARVVSSSGRGSSSGSSSTGSGSGSGSSSSGGGSMLALQVILGFCECSDLVLFGFDCFMERSQEKKERRRKSQPGAEACQLQVVGFVS